jgi:hypothetical protein
MLIRVRSKVGTWRLDGFEESSKVGDIIKQIQEKYRIPAEAQTISRDPGGTDSLGVDQSFASLGIKHGEMLHAQVLCVVCVLTELTCTRSSGNTSP